MTPLVVKPRKVVGWGIFNTFNQLLEIIPYKNKSEAQDAVDFLNNEESAKIRKERFFLNMVKIPIV